METRGWWGDDVRFRYDCKEYGPVDNFQCRDWRSTSRSELGPEWTLAYLDRHKVECGKFEGLQEIKANSNGKELQFSFKCCSVSSDRVLASQSELFWDKTKVQMEVLGAKWPVSKVTHKLLDKLTWEYTNPARGVITSVSKSFSQKLTVLVTITIKRTTGFFSTLGSCWLSLFLVIYSMMEKMVANFWRLPHL